MQFNEFLGEVRERTQLPTTGHALAATRATLETLGERLAGGEPKDLASQLPQGIAHFVIAHHASTMLTGQHFDLREFLARVGRREGVPAEIAARHAQAVLEVVKEAVSPGEIEQVRAQLPEDIRRLLDGNDQIVPDGIAASAASAYF